MDPANHTVPGRPAFGRIAGRPFGPDVSLQGNTLVFRQAKGGPEVTIELPVKPGQAPDGLRVVVHPDQKGAVPKVTVKARKAKGKDDPEARPVEKYALTLELGQRNKDGLPGKVYLCLPDEEKSYLVGTFEAEIK